MRKMMFNDQFGLTDAVLEGLKTQTRRLIKPQPVYDDMVGMVWKNDMFGRGSCDLEEPQASYRNFVCSSPLKEGTILAVAQRYSDCGSVCFGEWERETDWFKKGFSNKMFVKSELMPHHIKITKVRVQRLQDITDDECILEGVRKVEVGNKCGNSTTHTEYSVTYYGKSGLSKEIVGRTPKEVYAFLIDAISGKGTWNNNPYVYVYDFELVRYGE